MWWSIIDAMAAKKARVSKPHEHHPLKTGDGVVLEVGMDVRFEHPEFVGLQKKCREKTGVMAYAAVSEQGQ